MSLKAIQDRSLLPGLQNFGDILGARVFIRRKSISAKYQAHKKKADCENDCDKAAILRHLFLLYRVSS